MSTKRCKEQNVACDFPTISILFENIFQNSSATETSNVVSVLVEEWKETCILSISQLLSQFEATAEDNL